MSTTDKFNNLLKFSNLQNQYNNLRNADLNGDGVVNKKDKKLFKKLNEKSDLNGDGKTNKKDKKLFKNLDTNSDGKINSKDLKNINKKIKKLLKSDETFDLNGDDTLDAKDFVKFMKIISNDKTKKKYNLTDDMIESLTKTFVEKTLDSDNNGQINIVDLEYFGKMLDNLNSYNESRSTSDLGDFSKKDVNLNGDRKVNRYDARVLRNTVISAIEKYTGISLDFITPSQQASDVNGEIDDFQQGQISDCWLLAGLRALYNTETGAKILKDSIRKNDDGSVTIVFNGVSPNGNEDSAVSYTITAEELQSYERTDVTDRSQLNAGDYSLGDNDVLAIELACQKLHSDLKSGKVKCGITSEGNYGQPSGKGIEKGGRTEWLIYYFTGVKSTVDGQSGHRRSKDKILQFLNDNAGNLDTHALSFVLKGYNNIQCVNGEYELDCGSWAHALTITNIDIDKQEVTFIDPHYGDKEYTTSFKEFSKLNIMVLEKADISKTKTKSEVTDMTGYEPPENKQYTDDKGNSVVDKYATVHGQRVLQQRTTTAPDGTVTIEKFEHLDKAGQSSQYNLPFGKNRYQNVVSQKIVVLPDGTTTTTDYGYEFKNKRQSDYPITATDISSGKYVLKYSTSTSSDGTNTTSIYETIDGKRYETKRTVTKDGITTTYNYKIVNGKRYLTSVIEKDKNNTVTKTNYKTDSDGTNKEDTRTVTDKDGNRTYYKFKMVDGKQTPVETAKSKYKEDIKWGETQGSYEIITDNKNKTSVVIRNKQGKKIANINISDYTNDFVSAKVQNIYSFNDNKMLSKSVITIKCSDSSTITITLEFDKDGKETKRDVVKN